MSELVNARPYAAAVLALAQKDGTLDATEAEMRDLAARLSGAPELRTLLTSPALRAAERLELANKTLCAGMSDLVQNLVHLLIDKRRINIAETIADHFVQLAEEARGVVRGTLTTAVPVSDADKQAIMAKLGQLTGKTVLLESEVDPSVIGGVRVRVQDVLLDHTVRQRLDQLRADLAQVRVH